MNELAPHSSFAYFTPITADALHCQTHTVQTIRAADAHYTIGVKANQKTLYRDISTTFTTLRADDQQSIATYETVEKGHGRIETRRYWLTDDLLRLSTRDAWKDLQSIGMVESERQIGAQVSHKTRHASDIYQQFPQSRLVITKVLVYSHALVWIGR